MIARVPLSFRRNAFLSIPFDKLCVSLKRAETLILSNHIHTNYTNCHLIGHRNGNGYTRARVWVRSRKSYVSVICCWRCTITPFYESETNKTKITNDSFNHQQLNNLVSSMPWCGEKSNAKPCRSAPDPHSFRLHFVDNCQLMAANTPIRSFGCNKQISIDFHVLVVVWLDVICVMKIKNQICARVAHTHTVNCIACDMCCQPHKSTVFRNGKMRKSFATKASYRYRCCLPTKAMTTKHDSITSKRKLLSNCHVFEEIIETLRSLCYCHCWRRRHHNAIAYK